jgi:FeoC like transcriptional regulator
MLHRLLATIQTGEVQSLLEIAHTMDSSPEMVLQMVNELTSKGYLQEVRADCDGPQKACPECPMHGTCQETVRHWFLTEKGRTAVSSIAMAKQSPLKF